jgi:predicted RNase H-like HicB family nuclease
MKYKRYTARIEYSKKDNCLIGRVANIRDIITFHGSSTNEIEKAFKQAVDFYLETELNPQEPNSNCIKGNSLTSDQAVYFRNQFREARTKAFQDAEAFSEILFAIERLGSYLIGEIGTLDHYRSCIQKLADDSPLAKEIPEKHSYSHIEFHRLYEVVMQARNDALHQGAYARHLTSRSIELSLVLEDALMSNGKLVCDYMVINPICADLWQPLSFIRQQMLANSFSFLPVRDSDECWKFISGDALAKYLQVKKEVRSTRMMQTLEEVLKEPDAALALLPVETIEANKSIDEAISKIKNYCPVLVTSDGTDKGKLIGILTSFDLL